MNPVRHSRTAALLFVLGLAAAPACRGPAPDGRGPGSVAAVESSALAPAAGAPEARDDRGPPDAPPPRRSPFDSVEISRPPLHVVRAMLELAAVQRGERVLVLGCGDGGIALAAHERGGRVSAVEPSSDDLDAALANLRKAGLAQEIALRPGDVLDVPMEDADVLLMFLPPVLGRKMQGRLRSDLLPGARVVSWVPAVTTGAGEGQDEGAGESGSLHYYRVPGRSHARALAPFVRTPLPVVHRMLELGRVTEDDVLYDLGCGDGRIVIEAARRTGARCVGIDFDARRIEEARGHARREGVEARVEFRHADIQRADLSDATVVTLFLLPDSNRLLKGKLAALRPGTRILSHQFDTQGWRATAREAMALPGGEPHVIWLWTVGPDTPAE